VQKYRFSGRGGLLMFFITFILFTVLRFENRFVFQEPEINHPGRESRSINIPKSAIPATPP